MWDGTSASEGASFRVGTNVCDCRMFERGTLTGFRTSRDGFAQAKPSLSHARTS